MPTINPYLTFNGNCEEAFAFYKNVFGGDFASFNRFNEMPDQPGIPQMPENEKNLIMHVSLPISKETILMGSDTGGEWSNGFTPGNNFSLSISTDSKAEADKLYQALSAGGTQTMPLSTTFWGSYFGMCIDKFGISWMIGFDGEQAA